MDTFRRSLPPLIRGFEPRRRSDHAWSEKDSSGVQHVVVPAWFVPRIFSFRTSTSCTSSLASDDVGSIHEREVLLVQRTAFRVEPGNAYASNRVGFLDVRSYDPSFRELQSQGWRWMHEDRVVKKENGRVPSKHSSFRFLGSSHAIPSRHRKREERVDVRSCDPCGNAHLRSLALVPSWSLRPSPSSFVFVVFHVRVEGGT